MRSVRSLFFVKWRLMKKIKENHLYDKLIDLYLEFGFYKESLISITKKGMDGQKQIADMMTSYRNQPPVTINGSPYVSFTGLSNQQR